MREIIRVNVKGNNDNELHILSLTIYNITAIYLAFVSIGASFIAITGLKNQPSVAHQVRSLKLHRAKSISCAITSRVCQRHYLYPSSPFERLCHNISRAKQRSAHAFSLSRK